jgi:hypothetical protein
MTYNAEEVLAIEKRFWEEGTPELFEEHFAHDGIAIFEPTFRWKTSTFKISRRTASQSLTMAKAKGKAKRIFIGADFLRYTFCETVSGRWL